MCIRDRITSRATGDYCWVDLSKFSMGEGHPRLWTCHGRRHARCVTEHLPSHHPPLVRMLVQVKTLVTAMWITDTDQLEDTGIVVYTLL